MKTFVKIAVGIALIYLLSHYVLFPTQVWHYKISVTIATPEGDKTGYAVREITREKGISLTPEMTASREVKGEAVAIDLGERGTAIAILRGASIDVPIRLFFELLRDRPLGEIIELPAEYHPIIVHYKNGDRKWTSLENVYRTKPRRGDRLPAIIEDDLEKAFGEGVFLRKIEISKVDEPVTRFISPYLPEKVHIKPKDGHMLAQWPYAFLTIDFQRGMED